MVYDSLILTVSTVCPYVTCAIPHFKSISATLVAIRITCFNIQRPAFYPHSVSVSVVLILE